MFEVIAGTLLGTFVGDAVGSPFEGSSPTPAGAGEYLVTQALARGRLTYTDDTQMTLALAEHLCAYPEVEPEALARTFLEHFEPGRGYGPGTRAVIAMWREGVPVAKAAAEAFPDGSLGNGAAMRIAPVGVLWAHDAEALERAARRSALVTHAHPVGVEGAVVQARAVALAAERRRFGRVELAELASSATTPEFREGLAEALQAYDEAADLTPVDVAVRLGTAPVSHRSVAAALWAAATAETFAEGVASALELGGDVDTIAAMTSAVLGAAGGLAAIPSDWLATLEDGDRGRTYALDLAERLASVAERLRG